jgi:hypothetical protein
MKWLLFLLIILSVCVGIKSNVGWISLWGSEFQNAVYGIGHNRMTTLFLIKWILLIFAHIGVVILPFIINKPYFRMTLILAPIAFVIFFMLWDLFTAFFLIPFVFVWIICLIKAQDRFNIQGIGAGDR